MAGTFQKNRMFAKYGHECEMANELDVLPIFIPGNDILSRIKRTCVRIRTVSETSKQGARYFRSQGAIADEKHRHLESHPSIIHPFSDVRKWWQCFMCWVFLLQFIVIPLDVAYFRITTVTVYGTKSWKWTRVILDCLCLIDVLLNFATGYYNDDTKKTVLSPGKIASHYLTTFFVPDFISSVPTHIDVIIPLNTSRVLYNALQITSLLRIVRYYTFIYYLRDLFEMFDIPYAMQKTIRLLVTAFLYCHLVACMLIFSFGVNNGFFGSNPPATPSSKITLLSNSHYSEAFYYSLIITSCAGYGKRPPRTFSQIVMTITLWLISQLFLIIFTGRMVQVIKPKTSSNYKYVEMLRQLREYMCHKQLPEYMQRRLLTYYEFRFQKSYFREAEILATISGQLRQELVMHSCRKLVENVAFFKNLPLNLLVRIVSCLRSEIFLINDVIVRANTPGNCMFFIASGTVAVYSPSGKEVCHLEDGGCFGEIALVMRDELRVASVVAVEVCELYRLDRREFVRAIHPYPDLLDNIQRMAADRMEKTTMLDEHNRREMASKKL